MCNLGKPAAAPDQLPEPLLARLDQALKRMADGPAAEIETPLTVIRHPRLAVCHYLELLMAYLLPRTILVVIAWGVTCALMRRIWPSAEIPAFAAAGASWLVVGVAYFGYLNKLRRDIAQLERARSYTYARRFPLN
jgi:hypothetical protein